MASFVETIPAIWCCIIACMEFVQVGAKCSTLRDRLQQLEWSVKDLTMQSRAEVVNNPCKKQKQSVNYHFEKVAKFRARAQRTLEKLEGQCRWQQRIWMVRQLHDHLRVVQGLLDKAWLLQQEGLTRDEVCMRGMRLFVDKLVGNTANGIRRDALESIRMRSCTVGIHGSIGSGTTNLMKFVHNDVYDDPENFKAVFWAGAPEEQCDAKSIQDCLADAMKFKFNDQDVVRRASLLLNRFKRMAPGHVVVFLDNVKEDFLPLDVGIPIGVSEAENFCLTLVLTAKSEDVCYRMRCTNKFKMDLLPEDEARQLFLQEAGWNNHCTRSSDRRIQEVADEVVRQCARMPLVITLIARSMIGKEVYEWRNQLNALMGIVESMDDTNAKILEQLKFSFNCLKATTIQDCFLASATILLEGNCLPREELIQGWIFEGLIGKKCRRDLRDPCSASFTSDQGHTIINILKRAYLLEVVMQNGTECVTMNKWIRKMAESICDSRGKNGEEAMNCKIRGKKRQYLIGG